MYTKGNIFQTVCKSILSGCFIDITLQDSRQAYKEA